MSLYRVLTLIAAARVRVAGRCMISTPTPLPLVFCAVRGVGRVAHTTSARVLLLSHRFEWHFPSYIVCLLFEVVSSRERLSSPFDGIHHAYIHIFETSQPPDGNMFSLSYSNVFGFRRGVAYFVAKRGTGRVFFKFAGFSVLLAYYVKYPTWNTRLFSVSAETIFFYSNFGALGNFTR